MLSKKTVYNKLVAKVNSVDTSEFVLKTKYDTHESDLEKRIPDTSGLVKILDYNANVTEMENKIGSICGFVEKNLVKKQIITQKLLKSKKNNLLIMIVTNILLLQNLII